jgi:ABC-2 type transport system permease protein
MTHWHQVFLYEFRLQFRRKAYRFMTFVVPALVIAAFFGYQLYKNATKSSSDKPTNPVTQDVGNQNKQIGYVDQTPNGLFPAPDSYPEQDCQPTEAELTQLAANPLNLPPDLIKRLSAPYCSRATIHQFNTRQAGIQALKDNQIDALYVIGPSYVQDGKVSQYTNGFSIKNADTDSQLEDYLLSSMLYKVDAQAYEQLYLRLRDPAVIGEHRIAQSGAAQKSNDGQNFVVVYVFALLLMMTVFWGGGYLMQSVVQEKESRVIEILLSSVRPTALLLGKILAMGLLSLLQVGLFAATFVFLASQAGNISESLGNVDVNTTCLLLLPVYFILGFLLFGSLMAVIGAMSMSAREAQNFVAVITLPAMIPLFFMSLFVSDPGGPLPTLLSIFPLTAPMSMIMRLAVGSVPALQLFASLGLLAVVVVLVIGLSGRVFRVNILLMGNTPKLRDIPRLLWSSGEIPKANHHPLR